MSYISMHQRHKKIEVLSSNISYPCFLGRKESYNPREQVVNECIIRLLDIIFLQ